MPTRQEFFTRDEDIGQRLDRWLAERLEHSRTQIQAWIKLGHVLVNGSAARASRLLEPG
ncbi:RluA family pseudouridine synthase, partial [Candidatus Acetothermia bacterium]|nr:RluA family pseudouridine synthase [Candidatus Acetothermia bacterium]